MPNSKDCELNGIEGLTFYDQEDFEQNVTKKLDDQIDKQKKEHDAKRLQLELKSVESNLEKAEKNAAKVEQALHNAVAKGITSDRRLQGFLDDQDKYKKEVINLTKSKEEILAAMIQTQSSTTEETKEEEDKSKSNDESQQEKSIRLGQLTAFGKVLASKTQQDKFISGRNYVKDWMDTEETDDEEKDQERPKSKKNIKSQEWHTDDSDWESSDKEEKNDDDDAINEKIAGKKKPQKFRTIDDGDKDIYLERLKEWQDSTALAIDSKYEELEGGLRVPSKIWQSLYHYQKVAVQWMWELHQQDVGGILGDEMGLGKTVQLVAFLASLSYSSKKHRSCRLKTALIVTPTTVMHQVR